MKQVARVLLTKNELKKQLDSLKRFKRYLPTLLLKKQQLATVIHRIDEMVNSKRKLMEEMFAGINEWIAVMAEPTPLEEYIALLSVDIEHITTAGVLVPVVRSIRFKDITYDLFTTPYWLDTAVHVVKTLLTLHIEIDTLQQQVTLLKEELKTTTQRVNLFEIVKIPEAQETIRRIQIVLADQQTASVVRGKFAKRKMTANQW